MAVAQSFDLVVVGGGFAGLVAANRAAQLGLKVAVLERGQDETYPCNSRYAGGVLHISYHDVTDPQPELARAVEQITDGYADRALVTAYTSTARRAVEWLTEEGAKFVPDGAISWRQWVLAPRRPPVTHMEWQGIGADVTLRRLEQNLVQRGGEVHRGTRALSLIMDGERCVGVEAQGARTRCAYDARAVLIADGGFQADTELLRQHVSPAPQALKQRNAGTGCGDGLKMAQKVGAAVSPLEPFYGHLLSRDAFHNERLWPYPQIDELGSGGVVVDARGRRIADEGIGGVYLANAVARLADPASATVIFDETIWQERGRSAGIPPNPVLVKEGGTLHQADTIAELAGKAGFPLNELESTLRVYNDAVRSGRCEALDPPRSSHKRVPMSISAPPFYAVPICAGITYTMGGIMIDAAARVLRPDRTPIPGLYAAGSTTGGLDGGHACGYAGGLMKAIVFGLLAAEHAGGSLAAK
ncbi:MAG: FAD-dependent oxidoreductase [Betaproteobacteria bacterium]|nr:FAD-dependent oxidoreductase [Betaproteobacteria bacterium]